MIFLLYDDRNHPGGFLLNLAACLYGVVQCVADDHEQVCCGEIQPTVDPNLRPDRNAKFFGFLHPVGKNAVDLLVPCIHRIGDTGKSGLKLLQTFLGFFPVLICHQRFHGRHMLKLALTENDTLVGIAASGRTPYVLGAMKAARDAGAGVIGLTCCPGSEIDRAADVGISPDPGPEVITGSTRMKCGTAQKMVLNMLSTCTMVKLGKVYGNLMVDVKPSNEKLVHRCISIVREATGADEKTAVAALEACGYKCKTAIVMLLCSVSADEAEARLGRSDGRVADAIR